MRVLAVAAHPDDETLGAGGTIARFARAGHEVWVCILTDGASARHQHVDRQKDCAMRAGEVLGVAQVTFAGFEDQRLDGVPLIDVITPIDKAVVELQPQLVLTHFGQDVNQDHRVAFAATMVATRPVGSTSVERVMCYQTPSSTEWAAPFTGNVFSPNVYIDISSTLSVKLEAMRQYARTFTGEVHPFPHPRSYQALEAIARSHGSAAGLAAAESFMLVRAVEREGEPDYAA
jgi:LmbE family N-acetylglucosaminyl deacetylase